MQHASTFSKLRMASSQPSPYPRFQYGAPNPARLGVGCLLRFGEGFHPNAGANEIAIAVYVIDATDCGPEFVLAHPTRRKCRVLARIGAFPFVGTNDFRRVRSEL